MPPWSTKNTRREQASVRPIEEARSSRGRRSKPGPPGHPGTLGPLKKWVSWVYLGIRALGVSGIRVLVSPSFRLAARRSLQNGGFARGSWRGRRVRLDAAAMSREARICLNGHCQVIGKIQFELCFSKQIPINSNFTNWLPQNFCPNYCITILSWAAPCRRVHGWAFGLGLVIVLIASVLGAARSW